MKKVFLFACVAFALASCGNKAASNDEVKEDTVAVATDSDEAAEVTTALEEAINAETKDPSKIEATLTKVKEEYAKLVEEGKVEEAKKSRSSLLLIMQLLYLLLMVSRTFQQVLRLQLRMLLLLLRLMPKLLVMLQRILLRLLLQMLPTMQSLLLRLR